MLLIERLPVNATGIGVKLELVRLALLERNILIPTRKWPTNGGMVIKVKRQSS